MLRPARVFALLATLLLAACNSGPASITPNGEATIALSTDSKTTRNAAKLANRVTITLPPGDPGYAWQIAYHDTRFLKQLTEIQPPATPDARPTIAFLAQRTGTTRLRFVLLPATPRREAVPIDGHDLVLTIQ